MPALWDNLVLLDLAVPSNGPLTPGSGTVYVGGPRLPAELVAVGANAAVVWYSSGVQSLIWKYSFIANTPTNGFIEGQVDANGVLWNVFTFGQAGGSLEPNLTISASAVTIDCDNPGSFGLMGIQANNSLINSLEIDTGVSGSTKYPVIKAVNSSNIDVWSGNFTATNVNINGVLTCSTFWNWYLTPDYKLELHWFIRTNGGAFPAVGFLTVPIPAGAGIPSPMAQTAPMEGPYGVGQGNSSTVTCRIDSPATGMFVFINNNPNASGFFSGTISYQVAKP